MELIRKKIKIYRKSNGDCPFLGWLELRHRVQSRLARVSIGNLGAFKILGNDIGELKFTFGSGYRIYYTEMDEVIMLLLCARDKATQKKDIKLAKTYLKDYLQGENHGEEH